MTEQPEAEQIVNARFPNAGEGLRASLLALVEDSIRAGRELAATADEETLVQAVANGGRWSMSPDVVYAGWWPSEEDHARARELIESLRYAGYEIHRVSGNPTGSVAFGESI